jgi:hypothetical protein
MVFEKYRTANGSTIHDLDTGIRAVGTLRYMLQSLCAKIHVRRTDGRGGL